MDRGSTSLSETPPTVTMADASGPLSEHVHSVFFTKAAAMPRVFALSGMADDPSIRQ